MQYIIRRHRQQCSDFLHRDFSIRFSFFAVFVVVVKEVDDGVGPVGAVTKETEIGEGFLGGAELAFAFGELVAECYEEFAVAFPLILWEGEDASYVIPLSGFFFFAEIADEMASMVVAGGHAVEKEGIDVVIECFVIQEEFA